MAQYEWDESLNISSLPLGSSPGVIDYVWLIENKENGKKCERKYERFLVGMVFS